MTLWIFTLTACDTRDECGGKEWHYYCGGDCTFTIATKDPIPGMPATGKNRMEYVEGTVGEALAISLDEKVRKDLLQYCKEHNVFLYPQCIDISSIFRVYADKREVGRTYTTATDDITGGMGIYYLDAVYFGKDEGDGYITPQKSVRAYLLKEGFVTLMQHDDKGMADKFIITYTPNPEYEAFLKEHDLYSSWIRIEGDCKCKEGKYWTCKYHK